MSLLDRGTQVVTVYPEVDDVDQDGNPIRRPSTDGVPNVRVMIQPMALATVGDEDRDGPYRMRFTRGNEVPGMGPRALVEWRGEMWGVVGHGREFSASGSRRTRHVDYTIRRT